MHHWPLGILLLFVCAATATADPLSTVDDPVQALEPSTVPADTSLRTDGTEATLETTSPLCEPCQIVVSEDGAGVDGPASVSLDAEVEKGSSSTPSAATTSEVSAAAGAAAGISLAAILAAIMYKMGWFSSIAAIGLFSRIKDDEVLDHPLRSRIVDHVQENPGAPVKQIQEMLEASHGTTTYHLALLEKRGILVSQRDGTMRRYWREDDPAARDRKPAILLGRPQYRRIARFVKENPGVHQTALCEALGIRKPAASKRLRRLQDEGLVSAERRSRRCHYWAGDALDHLLPQSQAVATAA